MLIEKMLKMILFKLIQIALYTTYIRIHHKHMKIFKNYK